MSKVLATKCQHTDRPMHARGLCKACYVQYLRGIRLAEKKRGVIRRPKQYATNCPHRDRPANAHGLCASCYGKWLRNHNPQYGARSRELSKRWRALNPQKRKDGHKAWLLSHPDYHIKKRYGLSIEQLNAIIQVQDDKCPICQIPLAIGQKQCIDHDHVTGSNRGVLCNSCNAGLGMFNDSIDSLLRAVRYLQFPPCNLVTTNEVET
jgi:hypothetical protein